jgi:hypothetical protein
MSEAGIMRKRPFSAVTISVLFILTLLVGCPAKPTPAEFEIVALEIDSEPIAAGEAFNVIANVTNKGGTEGVYMASLKVNGLEVDSKDISIPAGGASDILFPVTLEDTGTYTLEVGGISTTLNVLEPAELLVTNISVSPSFVFPGEEVTIEATARNIGEVKGSLTSTLYVNGVEEDSRQVTLAPDAVEDISFSLVRDVPGEYKIDVSGYWASADNLKVWDVETYYNDRYYFSIKYPTDWKVEEYLGGVVMQKSDEAVLIVTVEIVDVEQNPEDLVKSHIGILVPQMARMESDSNEEDDTEILKYRAIFCVTDDSPGPKLCKDMVFIKNGRYFYTLVLEALSSDYWGGNRGLYEACLRSFKPPRTAVGSYTDAANGFSIGLPRGWCAVKPYENYDDRFILDIHSPVDGPNIFMYMLQDSLYEDTSNKEHAASVVVDFSNLPDYELISEGAVSLGADTEGYEYVFTNMEGIYKVMRRVVSIVRGTRALTLVTKAVDLDYREKESEINQIYNSLTFVEKATEH